MDEYTVHQCYTVTRGLGHFKNICNSSSDAEMALKQIFDLRIFVLLRQLMEVIPRKCPNVMPFQHYVKT